MIKGTRTEGVNTTEVGTGGTVLTPDYAGVASTVALVASAEAVGFYDLVMSGGTAASGTSNAVFKYAWDLDMGTSGATAIGLRRVGATYHFTNGPEFSRAVSVEVCGDAAGSNHVPTGCIWVAGILR
jgi:hypothetical protein